MESGSPQLFRPSGAVGTTNHQLSLLAAVTRLLASSLDVEATLREVAALIAPAFADRCGIHLVEGTQIRVAALVAEPTADPAVRWIGQSFPLDSDYIAAKVARTGRTEVLPEILDGAPGVHAADLTCDVISDSAIIVPLRVGDRILGTMGLGTKDPRPRFQQADGAFVEEIAAVCALAIDNARHYAEATRRREEMEVLARASHDLAEAQGLEATLASMAKLLSLFAERAVVHLMESDGEIRHIPSLLADKELEKAWHEMVRDHPGAGFVASVINSGEPLVIPGSTIILPLKGRSGVLGAIGFGATEPGRCDAQALPLLQDFANRCAVAIENARNFDALKEAQARFEFLSRASLVLAESLDYETTLKRVAELPVPALGDRCTVVLLENGELHWVAEKYQDPELVRLLETVLRRSYRLTRAVPLFEQVLDTGKVVIANNRGEDQLPQGPEELKEVALKAMAKSAMAAPMVFNGRTIGFLSIGHNAPGAYKADDADVLQELANRCALVIENSRNFTRAEHERARFQRLVGSGTIGIILCRGEVIVDVNEAYLCMTGYAREDIVNRRLAEMAAPQSQPAGERMREELQRVGKFTAFEQKYKRKDGAHVPVLIGGAALDPATPDPDAMEWVAFVLDLSESKAMEEKMRHTQKLQSLGVLAGGVAHDFNNLLTGIICSANLAADMVEPGSLIREMVQGIQEAGERAAMLTRQLLAYSGKGKFIVEPLDLSDFVGRLNTLVRAAAPKSVRVHLDLAHDLPAIEADATQVQQIVMNLVINGAEAAGAGPGNVWIATRTCELQEGDLRLMFAAEHAAPGRHVCLEVRDSGCGMTQETISKIFDPFFTTKFTGRGLGMSAVLGIVRGHQGAIRIDSQPEEGSMFQVFFPVLDQRAASAPAEPLRISEGRTRILVVDDEATVRNVAKAALERSGYTVTLATNGSEAVERVRANPAGFDLVLLDMTMPVMDGTAALRQIRLIQPNIPIVGSTGFSEAEALERFGEGIAAVVQKPYRAADLVHAVESILLSG